MVLSDHMKLVSRPAFAAKFILPHILSFARQGATSDDVRRPDLPIVMVEDEEEKGKGESDGEEEEDWSYDKDDWEEEEEGSDDKEEDAEDEQRRQALGQQVSFWGPVLVSLMHTCRGVYEAILADGWAAETARLWEFHRGWWMAIKEGPGGAGGTAVSPSHRDREGHGFKSHWSPQQ